jgi:uncharacterized tellurite resistance protein B-like protein
MLNNLKKLFSAPANGTTNPQETTDERLKVATCAILLEIAHTDDDFCDDERRHIMETLTNRFSLSEGDAIELIELADEARKKSRDLWGFTNQINEACDKVEKLGVIEEVWRVVFADGSIGGHENHLAHQLGRLLNLTHGQIIELKIKVLDELRS